MGYVVRLLWVRVDCTRSLDNDNWRAVATARHIEPPLHVSRRHVGNVLNTYSERVKRRCVQNTYFGAIQCFTCGTVVLFGESDATAHIENGVTL